MKSIRALTLIAFASTVGFVGCDNSPKPSVLGQASPPSVMYQPDEKDLPFPIAINLSVIKTLGNHSYIPMNVVGCDDECAGIILVVLNQFEKAHPELDVTSWNPVNRSSSYGTSANLSGLWVNHRPREKKGE